MIIQCHAASLEVYWRTPPDENWEARGCHTYNTAWSSYMHTYLHTYTHMVLIGIHSVVTTRVGAVATAATEQVPGFKLLTG